MSADESRAMEERMQARQERIQRLLSEWRDVMDRRRAIINQARAEKGWPPLEPRRRV